MIKNLNLQLEQLEERHMLSTVQIDASGTAGNEEFDLYIDDVLVESFVLDGIQSQVFGFESQSDVVVDQVRIEFTNDFFDPGNGIDSNLIIDKISIDGVDYQTEDPSTFSTGSYTTEGLSPGFWETEYLHTNGFFQYSTPATSSIEIIAAGTTGDEEFLLQVNGEALGIFSASQELESYVVQTDLAVDPSVDIVRVEFLNDLFIADEVDRDLIVDKIIVNDVEYESEADTTYSTGTWVAQNVPPEGFLTSETLNVSGYFEYQAATDIVIRTAGDEGTEQIVLQIDQQPVATFDLDTSFEEFTYRHITKLLSAQVRVEFIGDEYDPAIGLDKNVNVDWIEIASERFETESPFVFSNATYLAEGLESGFGRGSILHSDGFFQYGYAPFADQFSVPEDGVSMPLAVLANDLIADTVALEIIAGTSNGVVEIVDGVIRYTPNADFDGTDSFFYRLAEGSDDIVGVSVNVRNSHQQPQSQVNPEVPSELTPSGKALLVEKFAKLPLDDNGRQPRLNMMATVGERIFVVADGSFGGDAKIFELVSDIGGNVTAELFLDAGAAITGAGFEFEDGNPALNGLRSVAFHPEFDSNGKFYVTYIGRRPDFSIDTQYLSVPDNPVETESVLAEFTFDFVADAVDPDSYREVFRVGMPVNDHPIRQAVFNPFAQPGDEDYGLLYIGHGDGSEQSAVAGDGQNNDALGKILRIDPLETASDPFTVPDSNPFFGLPDYPDEVYALGFRNPHNLTFALDANGDTRLLVTEIGRDNVEEINLVVPGGNYGWANREGIFVHLNGDGQPNGVVNNIANLPVDEANNNFIYPVSIFGHDGEVGDLFVGQALAGGHVIQNGTSELDDQFIFVEFSTDGRAYHIDFSQALEQITTLDPDDPDRDSPNDLSWLNPQELTILFDHDNDDATTPLIRDSLKDVLDDEPDFQEIISAGKVRADLRLGQGPNGELYILNKRNGWIYVATDTVN